MAIIRAFKGWRPAAGLVEKVASKPYDVLNTEEARAEAEGNPHSFYHINKPEIDLDPSVDPYSEAVYQKASENLERFKAEGILKEEKLNAMYVYRQVMGDHVQTGLVACSAIEDYFNDIIKKHELTREAKEIDRINHMSALNAHVGPVFLTYPDHEGVDAIIQMTTMAKPEFDFVADDGIRHVLWVLDDSQLIKRLQDAFEQDIPLTYIADGHHRAASSAKVGQQQRELNPNHTGNEEYNYFLSVLFPASQLKIIDYNRVVTDLNGLDTEAFMSAIEEKFLLEKKGNSVYKPDEMHEFGMYLEGEWYRLKAKEGTFDPNDPVGVLDVSILSNNLLDPVLGIKDQRKDNRIDFVGGIRGLGELKKRVDSGEMKVAFALYPVSIQQLIDIADTGNIMPPKSTWFEPKLRSGLVIHTF